ncbi:MAG: 2,3-bisphosphoglycerate-independent phosphoglycerate mutase [Saprospiraceae bacterium]|nr:2,3-bisphosphoglycerate-independent phosphoglycerate mutase [Saprospiraceae bacterium]
MRKAILMILDGFGLGPDPKVDAIFHANTPCFDNLMKVSPHSTLITHGLKVGLPEGQMGNSEVGHINLGSGRVIYQDLTKIDQAISNNTLDSHEIILKMIHSACQNQQAIHLIGLVSEGGVHSHINHLFSLINVLEKSDVKNIYIHAITDGRDTDPKSFLIHVKQLQEFLQNKKTKLATIIGRYYAMDRDQRWERVSEAYNLYINNIGKKSNSPETAVLESYAEGITDEFIKPIQLLNTNGIPYSPIQENDIVFCFNFRSDRMRQLTRVLTQEDIVLHNMQKLPLQYYTMTEYDSEFKNVEVVFRKDEVTQSLGEMLSRYGLTQLRIAETEKYPHVTYFFNGGREKPFSGERRILIPSPKVATYDLKPSMSARELTEALLKDIDQSQPEFICLNFANTDMVGHTGVMSAAIEAAEVVDECLSKIVEKASQKNYEVIILADHGNADCMINPDGSPNTAHTKNPVPCIVVSKENYNIRNGTLADIAPTLLSMMQLPVPDSMTGECLVSLK